MATKVYKFTDIGSIQNFLIGQINGGNVSRGFPNLVGQSLAFVNPPGSVTFVAGNNPNDPYTLQLADIKSQVELAIPALRVNARGGVLGFVEAAPSTGVVMSASTAGGYATAVGTIDINELDFGGGGTLDTLDLTIDIDDDGPLTVTFAAPANRGDVVDQINAVLLTAGTASIDANNHLVIQSATFGELSSVLVTDAPAAQALGLTVAADVLSTGAATNGANTLLGFDPDGAAGKVYTPAAVDETAPCWVAAESSGENFHILYTWE